MGCLTESFTNLSDFLKVDSEHIKPGIPGASHQAFVERFLKQFLPVSIRFGMGNIVDRNDRLVGPFDVIACSDDWPPFGEGAASLFVSNGVIFALNIRRTWTDEEWGNFGEQAQRLKGLERKAKMPIFCGVVCLSSLPFNEVSDFLKNPLARSIDGVLTVGEHTIIRNTYGWYGDSNEVPFVSARGAGESMKSFAFLLFQLCQAFQGRPFHLNDYQHL